MPERPNLPPTPPVPVIQNPILQMAYGNIGPGPSPNLYRVERGFPFQRRGAAVVVASQFKALGSNIGSSVGLHSPVNQNTLTNGQLDPSRPGFLQKGSNVPTFVTMAFTFNATSTTALTISWPATPLRRANRQPALNLSFDTAIPTGSISITGLTANTQYFWYPFWSEAAKVLGWAGSGNATSAGTPAISQTAQSDAVLQAAQYQGFVPLNTLTFTMPNTGTSTVTGGYASGAAGLNVTGGGRQYRIF